MPDSRRQPGSPRPAGGDATAGLAAPARRASCQPLSPGLVQGLEQPALHRGLPGLPKPLTLPLPPASSTPISGTRQGEGGQEDFSGLRPRQPADSPRHVAWKAAARDGAEKPLLVKQFAGGAQNELWLDWRLLPANMDTETRLSALTGWVLAADAANARYGLSLPGIEIPPAEGAAHRQRCLEQLALH